MIISSKNIESIVIENNCIKFYFFSNMKDPLNVFKKDLLVRIEEGKITFQIDGKGTIAVARKEMMEHTELWNELVDYIS